MTKFLKLIVSCSRTWLCLLLAAFQMWLLNTNVVRDHVYMRNKATIPRFNMTIYAPCEINGNFILPSGRRLHAFKNAEQSLAIGELKILVVIVRTESESDNGMSVSLSDEIGLSIAIENGWVWNGMDRPLHIYFAIDTLYDSSFGHWIFESAIYLDYWNELKSIFPQLKLVLRRQRRYKSLVLPIFGISNDQVVYISGGSPLANFEHPEIPTQPGLYSLPNVVLIPPSQFFHDTLLNVSFFHSKLMKFVKRLRAFSDNYEGVNEHEQKHTILIIPRSRKENYGPNDRNIQELDFLASIVEGENVTNSEVLRTDKIIDIRQQVSALTRARVVFLGSGSAANFNLLFLENTTVYVLGEDRRKIDIEYPMGKVLWDQASRKNNIVAYNKLSNGELRGLLAENVKFVQSVLSPP